MRAESLEFLRKLVNTPSPPGHEQEVARLWQSYVEPYAHEFRTDLHGNTFATVNAGAPRRIMLASHVDEIAFIVHYIGEEGLLHFKGVGGHDSAVLVGQRVWVHGRDRVPGVIGRKPIHLLSDDDEAGKKLPEVHDLWIDIGVKSRQEAEKLVPLGSSATYQDEFQMLQGDWATARGFDNRVGAFCVAETLRLLHERGSLDQDVSVIAVATVQEEIGFRGATTASYQADAEIGLAVDVSHATDYPGISKERHGDLKLGGGPAITRGAFTSPIVGDLLLKLAEENGIPIQMEIAAECTGTDATPMQVARAGMAVGVVGIPLRYMHTPCEVLDLNDVEATADLMARFCAAIDLAFDPVPR